jgi:hypothetical protein
MSAQRREYTNSLKLPLDPSYGVLPLYVLPTRLATARIGVLTEPEPIGSALHQYRIQQLLPAPLEPDSAPSIDLTTRANPSYHTAL